ncbi:bifunctional DNA primase/polymerase [Mycolicibacterium fluoranthenivorans]|uniref:Bifunctional DNA primase/polymerase n=1 Tax=Mycolicibacterium fluoranthenivorans TaxID=258505 RepID=A0A7G8P8R8_9MYCO|nr:AAA family ATPase [Mycolicibacterium fluoranthenivorans]QNJ90734.1 bifunctional DNA primase/polymerase [Mycolicibacterium fluoranthenivorans]
MNDDGRPPKEPATANNTSTATAPATGAGAHLDSTGGVSGYAAAAQAYWESGWRGVLPLKRGTKSPPPDGFTGHLGADPSYPDVLQWAELYPDGNVALRLPDGVIGIDVDAYGGKTGAETLTEAVRRWGPLPDGPRSSSRADDPVSGIRLFRVPAGTRLVTMLGFPELGFGGVEIIQRHHRYAVCWPSVHPDTGQNYQWYGPDGTVIDPPAVDGLPDLPPAWLAGMADDDPADILTEDRADIGACLTEGEPSSRVSKKLAAALVACQGSSRHDNTLGNVLALLRFGRQNEPGVKTALAALGQQFIDAVTADASRTPDAAQSEFRRMVYGDRAAALLADDSWDWFDRIPPEGIGLTNGQVPPAPPGGSPLDDGQAESYVAAPADPFEQQVAESVARLRVQREAKRRIDAEDRPPIPLPPMIGLDELLTRPRPVTRYRIDKVAPADARLILSAQYKAGKTHLVGNLIRSLVDGDPFLGRFTVNTVARRVVLLDDELSEPMLLDWLEDQGIVNTDAVIPVSLRGRVGALDLVDDRRRREWATRLADLGCDYLILDCLRPVLDALGLDESHDAGRFLVGFDALLGDAGIADATMVHHMGHSAERSRGDSRLLDWPDANWRLVRETDQPDSARFFSAYGRDVDVAEGRLTLDPATRRLTYAAGSRANAKVEAASTAVILYLAAHAKGGGTGLATGAIERADDLGRYGRKAVRDGLALAVERGVVTQRDGDNNAKLHAIARPCEVCGQPVTGVGTRHQSCPPSEQLDDGTAPGSPGSPPFAAGSPPKPGDPRSGAVRRFAATYIDVADGEPTGSPPRSEVPIIKPDGSDYCTVCKRNVATEGHRDPCINDRSRRD